jgi:hypothetical protein
MSSALRRGTLAALPFLLALAACGESADPQPATARMDLVANGSPVTSVSVAASGAVTGGPLVVERIVDTDDEGNVDVVSDSVGLSAIFRRADGSAEEIPPEEYQLIVTPASTILRFIRASAFSGYLEGVAVGNTTMTVCLQRLADDACAFVPQATVQVQITQEEQGE